ncbi:5893_t:CDS:1, partial [Scutellospora calospora]
SCTRGKGGCLKLIRLGQVWTLILAHGKTVYEIFTPYKMNITITRHERIQHG